MKKIVIISDTHGNRRAWEELDYIFSESDYIIHLGDTSDDGAKIRAKYPDKTYLVNGNCDFMKLGENELILEIEGLRIFATHGHLYSAKYTLEKIAARAKELECKLALYGHTHRADEREISGVTLINPGTLSRYAEKSYGYLVIDGEKFVFKAVNVL